MGSSRVSILQMAEMSQWPQCLSKKCPKCLIEKNNSPETQVSVHCK